jgi:cysteinyl-tRNA synthetase
LQVQEIIKRVRGIELRWYLGSAHYRSMLEFSFEALEESAVAFRRIEAFLERAFGVLGNTPDAVIAPAFADAMNDDLAVPAALAVLSEIVKNGNNAITSNDRGALENATAQIRGALGVLGCDPLDDAFAGQSNTNTDAIDGLISLALQQREAARIRKDFAASDAIRDQIAALGIVIEDTPQGPRWTVSK